MNGKHHFNLCPLTQSVAVNSSAQRVESTGVQPSLSTRGTWKLLEHHCLGPTLRTSDLIDGVGTSCGPGFKAL